MTGTDSLGQLPVEAAGLLRSVKPDEWESVLQTAEQVIEARGKAEGMSVGETRGRVAALILQREARNRSTPKKVRGSIWRDRVENTMQKARQVIEARGKAEGMFVGEARGKIIARTFQRAARNRRMQKVVRDWVEGDA